MPRAIPDFLPWCAEHGIEIDERLEIRVSPIDSSMSVFLKSDASVTIGESLVRIPKSMVFSVKNCFRSRDVSACPREDPSLELSLAFLLETFNGAESRWHGYFASLPEGIVDIGVFWGITGDQDGIEAKEWLKGTEAAKILSPPMGWKLLDRVNTYFENIAKPILSRLGLQSSLEEFYRAYSIVSSRAFLVDAYHGLSLVPVADVFDHIEDNHVHLESDYHVCPTCGSLDKCHHDAVNLDQSPPFIYNGVDTCEMVSNLPIAPGEEIFNTYEKGLTNAQLLCQYGFTLDVNENNLVTWSIDELLQDAAKRERTLMLWTALVTQWPSNSEWDELQLVYNPHGSDEEADEDGVPKQTRPIWYLLDLNADGQISHQLWLLLCTLAFPDVNIGAKEAISVARQVAQAQEHLETSLASEVTTFGPGSSTAECRGPLALLRKIAETVVEICEAKIGSAHCAGMSESCIGEILDEMSADRPLTRRAVGYALEERKVVQACRNAWSEMAEICRE